jgi:hypothetical protein
MQVQGSSGTVMSRKLFFSSWRLRSKADCRIKVRATRMSHRLADLDKSRQGAAVPRV